MCDLQAIIEFTIELNKFVNIDLFQRGYYQIRVSHRIGTKLAHKIEVNFCETQSLCSSPKSSNSDLSNGSNNVVFPQCIVNGAAVSKTFQVMYKNEEIVLNDVITFKAHVIVDASQCIEQIRSTIFLLDVELWFSDQSFGPQHHNTIERVSARQLTMHFDVCRGLHYSLPVMFDYFHLSAVTVTIHASLITLCQPFLRLKKANVNGKGVQSNSSFNMSCSYDMLLFGCSLSALNSEVAKNTEELLALRMRRAQLIHWQLCSILLTAILSLHRKMREYIHLMPPWTQAKCQNIDMNLRFDTLSGLGQRCYKDCLDISMKSSSFNLISYQNDSNSSKNTTGLEPYSNEQVKPEDIVATVESDVSYLCGTAIIIWQQFLKVVLHNEKINQHLAKVHHLQRIKRFSEAFFAIEKQKHQICAICDNNTTLFSEISEALRKSSYLAKLPHCDVECVLTDGDLTTLPIIYEEKFDQDLDLSERCSASLSDIRLDETCNAALQKSSSECIYPQKKNLKEKLFNNLTRMNLGYGRLKEEYSPCDRYSSSHSNLAFVDRKYFSESKRKQRSNDLKESVTLVGFKKYEEFCGSKALRKLKVKETFSLYNLQTSNTKSMTTSESLPDLSSNHRNKCNSTVENRISPSSTTSCPITTAHSISTNKWRSIISRRLLKPPPKFRDDKNKYSISSEFQGTVYFPKPPPQFSVEETSSEEDEEEVTPTGENNSTDATPTGTRPTSRNDEPLATEEAEEDNTDSGKDDKCTILDMFKYDQCLVCGENQCRCDVIDEETAGSTKRLSAVTTDLISFVRAKEDFRLQIASKTKGWNFYSDFPSLASRIPYFQCDSDLRAFSPEGLHLVICVHGLDGNSADLRLVKTYLELGLPTTNFEFLMSQRNQGETFDDLDVLTDRLVQEISYHIDVYALNPTKISFIGHSLGNVIIRAALTRPQMKQWQPKLHTFLSLSGPHLGTAYNSSGLVNMGLWFMQKWKKSESLLQLTMKDACDPRETYLYKLSKEAGFEYFRNVLLCGSCQDHYVPIHSAHIELCNAALNDTSINGIAYREMVTNLLSPLMKPTNMHTKLIRYDVHHSLSSNANSLIGRAAHIAVLDSELFIEKFMVVCGLKYFG